MGFKYPLTAQLADPLALALGLKGWNDFPAAASASSAFTSQRIHAVAVPVIGGVTYTGLEVWVDTINTVQPTNFFVGLASSAASGVMLVQSADLKASASLTTLGAQRLPFSATYTPSSFALVYAVILQNGGIGPVCNRYTGFNSVTVESQFLGTRAGAGQTALPANGATLPTAYGTADNVYWIGLY